MVIGEQFAFFSRPGRGARFLQRRNPVVAVAAATCTTG